MNDDADDSNPPPATNSKKPFSYWVIGALLLAIIVVLTGAAFALNSAIRPKVGTVAVATANVPVQPTASPTSSQQLTSAPTSRLGTSPVLAAATATVETAPGASATQQDPKQAVATAYLHYWDVYNQALYDLNTAPLSQVMAGQELARVQAQVQGLRADNHAVKSDIQHQFVVVNANRSTAAVQDQLVVKSFQIDFGTKQALQSPGAGIRETVACQLERQNGTWKVVSVVRVEQ